MEGVKAAFILLGPEIGKKQAAIDELKRKFFNTSVIEEIIFHAGEITVDRIIFEIQNQDLFSRSRIFQIKDAELIKKKDEIDLLCKCISSLEKGNLLVIISEEIKLSAGLDNFIPKENKQIFYELFENEKNEWIRNYFRQRGFFIDDDCIETILELVENNTIALGRECTHLMNFLGDSKKPANAQIIKTEDAEKWLSHSREESAFTLFSRIAAGDFSKALESFRAIYAEKKFQERTLQITLAGLASCFRKLNAYHVLLASGKASNFIEMKKIGISAPKARDDYIAAARRYNPNAADACLALTAEFDLHLRSLGTAPELILLDMYLKRIFSP